MERGDWVLLDEPNLASQSVLEGLNAEFDHRGAVYVPVRDRVFPLHTKFFGYQNPLTEGGDRKGLPRSFLDRLSKVFMAALSPGDLGLICSSLYPAGPPWGWS
jgi:midasin